MNPKTFLALGLLAAMLAAGCGKKEEAPALPPGGITAAPAPPAQAVGESCSQDCGGGKKAAIQCAQGETPVCDCAATPNAVCKVPAAAGSAQH
jgi:hypothetical protein